MGWPAKGISALGMNISMVNSLVRLSSEAGEGEARWRKMISERLNSAAIFCFLVCVRRASEGAETEMTARGLPL